jgi:hypothetical protein
MTIGTSSYHAEIEAWRLTLEAPLRRDWISLVGRFELEPGQYLVGAHPDAAIRLPAGSTPDEVGLLRFEAGRVIFTPAPSLAVELNGAPMIGGATLRDDAGGDQAPDLVSVGSVSFFVIERGPRTMVRVRDSSSPALAAFRGRRWFPVNDAYRVEASFTPYEPPKPLSITNILGDSSGQSSPGFVRFTLEGQEHRLDATAARNGGLQLHFRDATNGELTYGGGRTLTAAAPVGGLLTLDFNRATNLPCAFTEFATCPMPPQQNRLPIPIAAGELLPE